MGNKPLYRERSGICSRGWLFMGENGGPCDQKCEMCYYAYQESLVFFSYETLVQHANLFRHYYGLDACDITGGEATIYRTKTGDIVDLVRHCAGIGLRPTIITHGQNLRDDFKLGRPNPLYVELEASGLEDWLVSLHGGSSASHDAVLGKAGSFERVLAGLDRVKRPVRFNTTILTTNYRDLPVSVLERRPPTVWNAINFNPFHAWSEKKEIDFQVQYREAAPYLADAVQRLESLGWEVNVRYWPLCIAKEYGFAENVCGYHQVPFDPWEWRLNVTNRTPLPDIESIGWYEAERQIAGAAMASRSNSVCEGCSHYQICDKPPEQYQRRYGVGDLVRLDGAEVTDPLIYTNTRGVVCV